MNGSERSARILDELLNDGLIKRAFNSGRNDQLTFRHSLVAHFEDELLSVGGSGLR